MTDVVNGSRNESVRDVCETGEPTYSERLYVELGRIAHLPLKPKAVSVIMRHFPEWTYRYARQGIEPVQVFETRIGEGDIEIEPPEPDSPKRRFQQVGRALSVITAATTGADIRYLIDIERQLPRSRDTLEVVHTPASDIARDSVDAKALSEAYRLTTDDYAKASDRFTERESFLLARVTHHGIIKDIAAELGVPTKGLSDTYKNIRDQFGIAHGRLDDLALISLSMGIASKEHIESGRAALVLDEEDERLISAHYSPDPDLRSAERNNRNVKVSKQWKKIYDKLGVKTRHEAMLFAVKDELIELPTLKQISEMIRSSGN